MSSTQARYLADVWTSSVDKHVVEGEVAVQLCNYTDVYKNDTVAPGEELMRATATADEVRRFHLQVGDSVLTKDSEDPADIGISAFVTATAADFVCAYHLAVARPRPGTHPRFLNWALRARPALAHFSIHASGISRYGLGLADLRATPIPTHPYLQQRRIADFLDDRVARIDRTVAAREEQIRNLRELAIRTSYDAVRGDGDNRRESGLAWLGTVPSGWPVVTVNTEFQVELGKMLDEKRQTGTATIPYLRNTNVQWDRVDTTDLKSMDVSLEERSRFTVRAGDLLICEGGQPGRCAIYSGDIQPLGFQKALHRARSRGRSRPEWLLECLRVAVHLDVFAVENGQTTIGHLTNEQLRSMRFPFPSTAEQDVALATLNEQRRMTGSLIDALQFSVTRLEEYKQSLITAAVTGELDVTTAGSGIPG